MIDLNDAEQRSAAAAEYVLGTLPLDDQAQLREALHHDLALRAEVYGWQDKLLSLSRHAAPAEPSTALWPRIDRAVQAMVAATARSVAPSRAAWWQRLGLWQGLSGAALALSLLLGVLLVQRAGPDASGPRYLAVLQNPSTQATGWVVELQAGRPLRLVPVAGADVLPPGRALQFWTKPQGAAGPTSLGLIRPGQALELPLARLPALEAQQLFEITLEPETGSPLDRPTGPILYLGRTVPI